MCRPEVREAESLAMETALVLRKMELALALATSARMLSTFEE